MKILEPVKCRIALRKTYNGRPVRPDHEAMNGDVLTLLPMWLMRADERYPGEWALGFPLECERTPQGERFQRLCQWIASGDVEVIAECGNEGG